MSISEELALIAKSHGGLLNPVDVVEFAKDPTTALHSRFIWDDSKAAEQYRLWQAREVIRVEVTVLPSEERVFRTYVSLQSDRGDGGYRSTTAVLLNKDLREQLLTEALAELERWQQKYSELAELAEIFAAANTLKEKRALGLVKR